MLAVTKYPREYVESCQELMRRQLAAYKKLALAAKSAGGGQDKKVTTALAAFDPLFFNHLVVVLEGYFIHRLRTNEGKDGNAMNEVRVLAQSITENGAIFLHQNPIKFTPETTVLGLGAGDPIAVNEQDFTRLSAAYFARILETFTEG